MFWQVAAFLAAVLSPLAYLPTLRRMLRLRTADGLTLQLGYLNIVSFSAWLAIASGVRLAMYLTLVAAACCAFFQFVLIQRYTNAARSSLLVGLLLGVSSFLLARQAPWLAAMVVIPIDMAWFIRAIRDVLRSHAAAAVSAWAWVLTCCSYTAWTAEAFIERDTVLFIQCFLLLIGGIAAWAATVVAHRRHL
jgi:hypothetical protein